MKEIKLEELRKINEDFKLIGKKMGCYIIAHPSQLCYVDIGAFIKETLYLNIEGKPYQAYFVCIEKEARHPEEGIIIGEYCLVAPVYNARLKNRDYMWISWATLYSDETFSIGQGLEKCSDLLSAKIKKHSKYFSNGELDPKKVREIRKYINTRHRGQNLRWEFKIADSELVAVSHIYESIWREEDLKNVLGRRFGVMILKEGGLPYAYLMASVDKIKVRVGENEFEAHFLKMESDTRAGIYYLAIPSIVKTTGHRSLFPVARAELESKDVIRFGALSNSLKDLVGWELGSKLIELILKHSMHIKNGQFVKNGRWSGTLAEHHIPVVLPTVSEKPYLSKVRDYCIRKNLDAQMVGHYTSDDY